MLMVHGVPAKVVMETLAHSQITLDTCSHVSSQLQGPCARHRAEHRIPSCLNGDMETGDASRWKPLNANRLMVSQAVIEPWMPSPQNGDTLRP
jgi:hypothetical protein